MNSILDASQLYNACDSSLFSFETTDDLEPIKHPVGQDVALSAVEFGTSIQQDGYNIFAMGPSGTGKHSTVLSFLQNKAKSEETPNDWSYVNNFKNSQKPLAIELPPGKAVEFKDDIYELIELLKAMLPTTFESNEYYSEKELIGKKYSDKQSEIFLDLQEEAKERDIAMNTTSYTRVTFAPIIEGKVVSAKEFNAIEGEQKEKITKKMAEFEQYVKEELRKVNDLNKSLQKELKEFDRKTTKQTVESPIDEVKQKYSFSSKIVEYLNDFQDDVIHHAQDFLVKADDMSIPPFMRNFYSPSFDRYRVNVFISNKKGTAAPVIVEDNPTHQNLIGKIEHLAQVGTLVTNFNMIKPGALHKANGGYIVLDAKRVLMRPFAYEELKRVIRSKSIRIESLAQEYSLISTTSLEPEPIPVDVKVTLIGERILYYLLYHYDSDFKELFKVSADFEDDMVRNDDNVQLYANMIATIAQKHSLRALTPQAVARVIEQSSREVSHASKFSTHLGTLADLLKEADYYSTQNSHKTIDKRDIEKALRTQIERKNRIQLKLYEQIDEGTIMINVTGETVGQINALSYISIGAHQFGIPTRITATTRIGKGEIIDIERKVELGGPLHSKGVMILTAFVGSKYAKDFPLSLTASLVFEQSYGVVEGDSASSTELYAILSSLSELPIKQNIAVTGSVNQFGEIQPIGGVNEKIEGFFDICMRQDPKASYGVIIPQSNVKHLMLKAEVIEAVEKGVFTIYGVKSIDEGISILTGVEAGEANKRGNFAADSVNGLVVARLKKLYKTAKEFYRTKKDKEA